MQEDINLRKAECGYEFPNDLESQMQAGEDGCISVYTSPSTVLTAVVNEAVYNAIFQEYAKTMLADFIASYDVVSVKTADELKALVDEHYEYEKEIHQSFMLYMRIFQKISMMIRHYFKFRV